MFGNQTGLRPTGVKKAVEGAANQGEPQTLLKILPMQMHGVEYYDERGRRRVMVVVEMAGQFYGPPNAHEWADKLGPVSSWMGKQIKNKLGNAKPVVVPEDDSVDPLGGDENPIGQRIAREAEQRRTEG